MNDDIGKINLLTSMGFKKSQAQQALALCNGDVDLAVDRILSGHISNAASQNDESATRSLHSTSTAADIIQTTVSQYSIPNGRSACTCIALQTASTILQGLNNCVETQSPKEVITPEHLRSLLISGVGMYNELAKHDTRTTSVEHLSPEEVMNALVTHPNLNLGIKLLGSVRQGVLTSSGNSPLGLKQTINECKTAESSKENEWMALVITKTPETICIFLPPKNCENDSSRHQYVVIDSHPRPGLSTEGCYAAFHASMDDFVSTLENIFPATDLGDDVGEIMAAMYNSFDVYPLQTL